MAKGKSEEHNPKRRPRKPTDPIPDDELMGELKKAFPGSTEVNDEPKTPPLEDWGMDWNDSEE